MVSTTARKIIQPRTQFRRNNFFTGSVWLFDDCRKSRKCTRRKRSFQDQTVRESIEGKSLNISRRSVQYAWMEFWCDALVLSFQVPMAGESVDMARTRWLRLWVEYQVGNLNDSAVQELSSSIIQRLTKDDMVSGHFSCSF